MQLGELLELGGQIGSSCWLNRGCVLLRGRGLLLRIGCALLVSLVILLLRSSLFIGILLLLVVRNCPCGADNNRRCGGCTDYSSAYTSSSHHFDLHY